MVGTVGQRVGLSEVLKNIPREVNLIVENDV
jgi:hypothetical protein